MNATVQVTIEDVVQAKRELERTIQVLLVEFTAKHRLRVDGIDLDAIQAAKGTVDYFVQVDAKL